MCGRGNKLHYHFEFELTCWVPDYQAIKYGDEQTVEGWLRPDIRSRINHTVTIEGEPIAAGGDSLMKCEGMTALHYAAFYCKPKIVQLLLEAGAGA